MEGLRSEKDPYGPEWFEQRAFESLHRMGTSSWDFSDSLLLYTPQGEEAYEAVQETDNPYHELVTGPEREYLEEIADRIMEQLPERFEYVDLGPGTEHKEQFLFDAARRQGKEFRYIPVDISPSFLEQSASHASAQGIEAAPVRSSFETLPERLSRSNVPRLVSIGLTYSNYRPEEILGLLKDIAGADGYALINSQLRERTDMRQLEEIYAGLSGMYDGKLRLLGLDPATDVDERATTDGIEAWCRITKPTERLAAMGVKPGDRILLFRSLRPTRESLEESVSAVFPRHESFDTGGPFVATLLKPNE